MGPRKEHQRRDAGAQRDAYQGGDNDALHLFAVSRQSEVTNLENRDSRLRHCSAIPPERSIMMQP
jgi:hypothetical protein